MSPHKQQRRLNRKTVCWYLLGILMVHVGVSIAVERARPALRDPYYTERVGRLIERCAEHPDRPLLLVLGSSRSRMGLDPEVVTRTDKSFLVYNFSELSAGPMLEQVFLRRLLAQGVRPEMVLLEVVPLQFASGLGVTSEATRLDQSRLTWDEMTTVAGSYRFRISAYVKWLKTHGLACVSKQPELHEALGIDTPRVPSSSTVGGDRYPYGFMPSHTLPEDRRVAAIQDHLARFGPQLKGSHLAAGPAHALRDLIGLCRREGLPFAVIYMPECSGLRDLYPPEFLAEFDSLLADLRSEGDFELIDARAWVPDEGFWDAHHLHIDGAPVFSARFAQEAIPVLRRHLKSAGDQKMKGSVAAR